MKNTFLATIFVIFCILAAPVTVFAAENPSDTSPWFIGDDSFEGHEEMNPSNYNTTDVFGSEYQNANQVLSGMGTAENVSRFNIMRLSAIMIPLCVGIGLCFAGYIAFRNISVNKKLKSRELDLKEKELEYKMSQKDKNTVPAVGQEYAPVTPPIIPTSTINPLSTSSSIDTGISVGSTMVDINGDGIIDGLDIMQFK